MARTYSHPVLRAAVLIRRVRIDFFAKEIPRVKQKGYTVKIAVLGPQFETLAHDYFRSSLCFFLGVGALQATVRRQRTS